MTDEQIIKALETHLSDEGGCSECAYLENIGSCVGIMHKDLYDLINRQKTKNNQLDETIQQLAEEINRQKAEVENQSENFNVLTSDHRTLQQSFDNLKGLYEAEKIKVAKAKEKCIGFAKELQTAKAELKETTEKFNCQQYVYTDLSDIIKEKNAEIEKLQADNSSMQSTLAKMSMGVAEARAEAIKECLDKFDIEYCKMFSVPEISFMKEFKRVFLKEMVGDAE